MVRKMRENKILSNKRKQIKNFMKFFGYLLGFVLTYSLINKVIENLWWLLLSPIWLFLLFIIFKKFVEENG